MQTRNFGRIGQISALTLGGGGVGNVWGCTTRQEAVATVREAVADGITFIDLAPRYGDGEAESVMGQAFHGVLPPGLRISTKYRLGNPSKGVSTRLLEDSLDKSLCRMNLERIDLFFLHGQIIQDQDVGRYEGTSRALFTEVVRPWFGEMVSSGKIADWGITVMHTYQHR